MQISDKEVQRILKRDELIREIAGLEDGIDEPSFPIDPEHVRQIAKKVIEMPDREDRIAELKAAIESGTYHPTADEIANAMVRRAIADRVR